jgi:hypothetical protein
MRFAHYGLWFLGVATLIDGPIIREALRLAGLSLEKAAIWMEMDPRLLDRQLNGEGHLKHTALGKLPLGFWQWFGLLISINYGTPAVVKRSAPIVLAQMAHKRIVRQSRQIKMQLAARQKEKATA